MEHDDSARPSVHPAQPPYAAQPIKFPSAFSYHSLLEARVDGEAFRGRRLGQAFGKEAKVGRETSVTCLLVCLWLCSGKSDTILFAAAFSGHFSIRAGCLDCDGFVGVRLQPC